jgi:hypothetical protein
VPNKHRSCIEPKKAEQSFSYHTSLNQLNFLGMDAVFVFQCNNHRKESQSVGKEAGSDSW